MHPLAVGWNNIVGDAADVLKIYTLIADVGVGLTREKYSLVVGLR